MLDCFANKTRLLISRPTSHLQAFQASLTSITATALHKRISTAGARSAATCSHFSFRRPHVKHTPSGEVDRFVAAFKYHELNATSK